jgi:hypothetical protein
MLAVARGKDKIYLYSFAPRDNNTYFCDSTKSNTLILEREISDDESFDFEDKPCISYTQFTVLETVDSKFKIREVDLELNHDHFHGEILVDKQIEHQSLLLPENKFPHFYRSISGECLLDLTKGKFIKYNF